MKFVLCVEMLIVCEKEKRCLMKGRADFLYHTVSVLMMLLV